MIAIQNGEKCIYETDDDNAPNKFWFVREKKTKSLIAEKSSWIIVYRHFTNENIWPRGFLLDKIGKQESAPKNSGNVYDLIAPIQQGLSDISPDVDAECS